MFAIPSRDGQLKDVVSWMTMIRMVVLIVVVVMVAIVVMVVVVGGGDVNNTGARECRRSRITMGDVNQWPRGNEEKNTE